MMRILLIEDEPHVVEQFTTAKKRFEKVTGKMIDIQSFESLSSLGALDTQMFDFAIVDLNLDGSHDLAEDSGGADFIVFAQEKLSRIPIIIHSAHASPDHHKGLVVKSIIKGDIAPLEIFKYLDSITATGLSSILGGRGNIEEWLSEVVVNVINPHLDSWIENASSNPDIVKDSLLRHVLNHLIYKGQTDTPYVTAEEFYLLNVKELRTGLIMSDKVKNEFIVINPSCDLCNKKAPMIYLLPLEPCEEVYRKVYDAGKKASDNRDKFERVMKNSDQSSHSGHWLPKTELVRGGRVCFKSLLSISYEKLFDGFESVNISVADSYVSNIQDRFTSYLSRVGQPDISYKQVAKEIVTNLRKSE